MDSPASTNIPKSDRHVHFADAIIEKEGGEFKTVSTEPVGEVLKKKETVVAGVRPRVDAAVVNTAPASPVRNGRGFDALWKDSVAIIENPIFRERRVGTANLKRDLPIFIGIMAMLFLVAYRMDDGGKPSQPSTMDTYVTVRDAIRNRLKNNFLAVPQRVNECSLYLAESSIPGDYGFGIYAGKDFSLGMDVLNATSVVYEVYRNQEALLVSHYGLALKHHHMLHNLKGDGVLWSDSPNLDISANWKASRGIQAGEELFLRFEDHPGSVLRDELPSYPLESDFALAKQIMLDEMTTFKPYRGGRGSTERPLDANIFRFVRNTVGRFNPKVGWLLPWSMAELDRLQWPKDFFAVAVMRNKTLSWLSRNGRCLNDVELLVQEGKSETLMARRQIKAGDVVLPVPLYVSRADADDVYGNYGSSCLESQNVSNDNKECSSSQPNVARQNCFGHPEVPLFLCPLSIAVFAKRLPFSSKAANVKYQWSKWHQNNKASHSHGIDDVIKSFSLSLSWDMVATKEIKPGEEIRIAVESGSGQFGVTLPRDLLPSAWRRNT